MSSVEKMNPDPVEFVCLEAAFIGNGHITGESEGETIVRLDEEPPGLRIGAQVILNCTNEESPRVIATITEVDGCEVRCERKLVRAREKRAYPRLLAGLPVRYRLIDGPISGAAIQRWLVGDTDELSDGNWFSPDQLMNFSVTGLRFDVNHPAQIGDLVLVELDVGDPTETWRCTARVVRVDHLEPGDREPGETASHELALAFEHIPAGALEALSVLTLKIQEALL